MTSGLGYILTLAWGTLALRSMGIMCTLERVQSAHAMEYSNKATMGNCDLLYRMVQEGDHESKRSPIYSRWYVCIGSVTRCCSGGNFEPGKFCMMLNRGFMNGL